MSANIPSNVMHFDHSRCLASFGYKLISQGKTRDIYFLDDGNLLLVASDRLSIFDFVLNTLVPLKGEILTIMNYSWMTGPLRRFPNHLVKSSKQPGKNAVVDLNLPDFIEKRSLVVKKIDILPAEIIHRYHLGGSVYNEYIRTGKIGDYILPPNLPKWSKLPTPIFTPSTKEETGHDKNIDAKIFFDRYGDDGEKIAKMFKASYLVGYDYAEKNNIIILDEKGEGNIDMIADERFTPDCSRFCDKDDWLDAINNGREPKFMDKQPVRDWGKTVETPFEDNEGKKIFGINNLNPSDQSHIDWVHQLNVPIDVVTQVTNRYLDILYRLFKISLV